MVPVGLDGEAMSTPRVFSDQLASISLRVS